jgi:hypothetical protein
MTEHNSLYLRVRLSRHAYEHYLASACADARDFTDWMDWLGKAGGGFFTAKKIAEIGQNVRKGSTVDMIQALTAAPVAFGKSEYDDATETWRLGIPFFSESYVEYLERLPPLRAVDRFKDRPGVDFMLLYNYFFYPGDFTVLFEFTGGASMIAGSPDQGSPYPERYAQEADAFFRSMAPAEGSDEP